MTGAEALFVQPRERVRAATRTARFVGLLTRTLATWEVQRRVVDEEGLEDARNATKQRLAGKLLDLLAIERSWEGVIPPAEGPRLIVANHRTALDIGVLMERAGGHFLSRGDLAEWPVIGPLARHGGTIFVERGDKRSGAMAIRAIRRTLADGKTVIVYPEGSTFRGDEVRPFLAGAFAAARSTKAELLPVGPRLPGGCRVRGRRFHGPPRVHRRASRHGGHGRGGHALQLRRGRWKDLRGRRARPKRGPIARGAGPGALSGLKITRPRHVRARERTPMTFRRTLVSWSLSVGLLAVGGCTVHTTAPRRTVVATPPPTTTVVAQPPPPVATAPRVAVAPQTAYQAPSYVTVNQPPPPLRNGLPPGAKPTPDAVWVSGHWSWQGQWVWVPGSWQRAQPGYVWEPPVAVPVQSGGYQYHPGYWHPPQQQPPPVYTTPGTIRVHVVGPGGRARVVDRVAPVRGQPIPARVVVAGSAPRGASATVRVRPVTTTRTVTTTRPTATTRTTTARPTATTRATTRTTTTTRPATTTTRTTTTQTRATTTRTRPRNTPTPRVRTTTRTTAPRGTPAQPPRSATPRPGTVTTTTGGRTTTTTRTTRGTTTTGSGARPVTRTTRTTTTTAPGPTRRQTTTTTVRQPGQPAVSGTVQAPPPRVQPGPQPIRRGPTVTTTTTTRTTGTVQTTRPTTPTVVRPGGPTVAGGTPTVATMGTADVNPVCRVANSTTVRGSAVVVTGRNLQNTQELRIGGTVQPILSRTATRVRARVVAAAGGAVEVRVGGRLYRCGDIRVAGN